MKELNKEFNVPYYIFEEIVEYVELTKKGYSKCMKWENIKSLLRLAVINGRITEQQAKFLKKEFCREDKMIDRYMELENEQEKLENQFEETDEEEM